MNMLPLFPEEPPSPRPAPVKRITFTGPYDRRALVITPSFLAWIAWMKAHHTEYGAATWVLDDAGALAFNDAAFEMVRI